MCTHLLCRNDSVILFQGGLNRVPPNLRRTFNAMNFFQNSVRKPVPTCKRVSELHSMLQQLYNLHEVLGNLKRYDPINLIISDKNLYTFLKTNVISVSTDYCDCIQGHAPIIRHRRTIPLKLL